MISAELALARPTNGASSPALAARATGAGDHPQRGPRVHRLLAPLDLVHAGVLVGDRRLGRPPGDVVDQHGPRLRRSTAGARRC